MPLFDYIAADATGATSRGAVEAATAELALDTLKDRGLNVQSLEERAPVSFFARALPSFGGIPIKAIVIFSRQFSILVGAQVPIVESLRTVANQTQHRRMREIVFDVADEVEAGTPLSTAMAKYPAAFSDFFVNMIKSGETTGRLEEIMIYLADQMERDYDLMTKIKGAMIYPAFIMIGLVGVGFVMMVFVVPKLTAVLQESGAQLPLPTRILIGTSSFFQRYWILILVAAGGGGAGLRAWTATPGGKKIWDFIKLKVPVFGALFQRIYIVRFTRSFSTLLSGGVEQVRALEISADIVGNATYAAQIRETAKEVSDGNSVTTVFTREGTMPKMVPQMMSVGESTGRLHEVLAKLTDFYSRELQNLVTNLVSAIEPLIMLIMGLAVGVMVAAIILPMYSLSANF
ncbi:type II secretion system F family protein [Candidatus Uhrbacteria bacterium]|nr:type II secretion system F family protein [Candidatus Uhrbacteria bacterium]